MSKYKGQRGGKKGKQFGQAPPPLSGNAQNKTVFLIRDVT